MAMLKSLTKFAGVLVVSTAIAGPASAQLFGSSNDDAAQNTARIGQLEEVIRQLNGQVEQLSFQVRTLQDQLRRSQEDTEYRLQQLETPGVAPRVQTQAPVRTAPRNPQVATPARPVQARQQQLSTLNSSTGQATSSGPLDLSALATGGGNANVAQAPQAGQENILVAPDGAAPAFNGNVQSALTGDPRADYNTIYGIFVSGNYPAAGEGFDTFLGMYPDHELTSNAQHWLGQSLLAQRDFRGAADAFLKSYTDFPESELAPESLLKLGSALNGLGERDAACATYAELLDKFPSAAPAVLERAQTEKTRAKCN